MNVINYPLKLGVLLSLLYLILGGAATAFAQTCPSPPTPDSNWIESWSDRFNQTTYTLTAPCKVFVGVPFNITATVTDATHTLTSVAFLWSLEDNGITVAGGGFNWLDVDGAGQWQLTLTQTYTDAPIDHQLNFKFTDLGKGGGAHWWSNTIIGHITVDPFPPLVAAPALLANMKSMRNGQGNPPWAAKRTAMGRSITAPGVQLAVGAP